MLNRYCKEIRIQPRPRDKGTLDLGQNCSRVRQHERSDLWPISAPLNSATAPDRPRSGCIMAYPRKDLEIAS